MGRASRAPSPCYPAGPRTPALARFCTARGCTEQPPRCGAGADCTGQNYFSDSGTALLTQCTPLAV